MHFRLPLWNPYDRTGFPWFSNPNVAVWYPSNILFILLPVYSALNLTFFLHVFLTLIFSYLFAKSLKLSLIPSLTAAVAFAFAGFLPMRIYSGHREIIESLPWIPCLFLFLNKYFQNPKPKYLVCGSFSLALQFLAGNPTWAIYTIEIALIFTLLVPAKNIKFRLLSLLKILGLGLSMGAIQIIPFLELSELSTRASNFTFGQSTIGSFPPSRFITLILPFFYGNPLAGTYDDYLNFWELSYYPGISVLFLCLITLFGIKKNLYKSRAFLVIAVIMFIIALGYFTPVYRLLWSVIVFYQKTRFPARHLLFFSFALSMLAAVGSQLLKKNFFRLIFLGLIIFELFNFGKTFIKMESPNTFLGDKQLFEFLNSDKSLFRLYQTYDIYSWMRGYVSEFNTPFLYNIFTLKAYDSSILKSYHDFIDSIQNNAGYWEVDIPLTDTSSTALNFLNAKYFLTPFDTNLDKQNPKRFKKILSTSYYQLFENLDSTPRFFFNQKNEGSIQVNKYLPNEITLSVSTDKEVTLSSSEIYYPGWKAEVDGKKTDFLLEYNTYRAVKVPAGTHQIKWYFLPYSLLIGACVTLLSFILSLLIILPLPFRKIPVKM